MQQASSMFPLHNHTDEGLGGILKKDEGNLFGVAGRTYWPLSIALISLSSSPIVSFLKEGFACGPE